ncbi:MAG: hypothetical protein Q4Q53_08005 [Methanocorpusculum sp.]|nr:hypothetical protein [Methanocorpusculum sp.]
MDDNSVMYEKALKARGIETEISCAQAMAICNMFGFDRVSFREYCDSHEIKFKECSFGCF